MGIDLMIWKFGDLMMKACNFFEDQRCSYLNTHYSILFSTSQILNLNSFAGLNESPYFCSPFGDISLNSFSEIRCDSSVGRATD